MSGGQNDVEIAPIPSVEEVRTSSLRSSESEKSRSEGAETPEPNRLSRKVAPSGAPEVEPAILLKMIELAGTRYQL